MELIRIQNSLPFYKEQRMPRKIAIIGAGVGGILAIAKLLDCSVKPSEIVWIDPSFSAGRINEKYRTVESNDFVEEWCAVLDKYACLKKYKRSLEDLEQHVNENLCVIADVLLRVTKELQRSRIKCVQDWVTSMNYNANRSEWKLYLQKYRRVRVKQVIISPGSHPKTGPSSYITPDGHVNAKEVIELDKALNINTLRMLVKPTDCVVIVGSGQSAVLLMKYLSELGVHSITNVYRLTLEQTINSLRGGTLIWAKTHMQNVKEVERIHESDVNTVKCSKIIYATGFERNDLPECNIPLDLDNPDGILAPSLFGFGIAFPDIMVKDDGQKMRRVGLTSFCRTLDRRFPIWNIC